MPFIKAGSGVEDWYVGHSDRKLKKQKKSFLL